METDKRLWREMEGVVTLEWQNSMKHYLDNDIPEPDIKTLCGLHLTKQVKNGLMSWADATCHKCLNIRQRRYNETL